MNEKLTLRLDRALVEKAKRYGRAHGKSVSRLVADYFALLEEDEQAGERLPLLTATLRGALESHQVSEDDHRAHLQQKYLSS